MVKAPLVRLAHLTQYHALLIKKSLNSRDPLTSGVDQNILPWSPLISNFSPYHVLYAQGIKQKSKVPTGCHQADEIPAAAVAKSGRSCSSGVTKWSDLRRHVPAGYWKCIASAEFIWTGPPKTNKNVASNQEIHRNPVASSNQTLLNKSLPTNSSWKLTRPQIEHGPPALSGKPGSSCKIGPHDGEDFGHPTQALHKPRVIHCEATLPPKEYSEFPPIQWWNAKSSMNIHDHPLSGWWFQPLWKILVNLDDYYDYSQYMEK